MQIQLARLFGANSTESRLTERSPVEWKRILKKVLAELDRYLTENVSSDELHMYMLYSGLAAADKSLEHEDFWPGYVEGITRLALLLMGDYPDHRRRTTGKKRKDHYQLNLFRAVYYFQDPDQRRRTLHAASRGGFPALSENSFDIARRFRSDGRSRGSSREFMRWFRENYPHDYASLF